MKNKYIIALLAVIGLVAVFPASALHHVYGEIVGFELRKENREVTVLLKSLGRIHTIPNAHTRYDVAKPYQGSGSLKDDGYGSQARYCESRENGDGLYEYVLFRYMEDSQRDLLFATILSANASKSRVLLRVNTCLPTFRGESGIQLPAFDGITIF